MKKKIIAVITTLSLLTGTLAATAWALGTQRTIDITDGVNVFINGETLNMTDAQGNPVEAFIYNGTTYLPARAITEANGNSISWEAETGNVYMTMEDTTMKDETRANPVSEAEKGYTFALSDNVERTHVTYDNRYGVEIAADLYTPKNMDKSKKYKAIVIAGPFGAVKEQCAGLYANELAARGFVTLAFDPSFIGESGGKTRNMASPELYTEDYSAAVDYLGLLDYVDREGIGAYGICGLSGMAVTAASTDTRIQAVATSSMYDMSRDMSKGHEDYYTEEQRQKIMSYMSEQRWKDAENGKMALGPHEVAFDANNNPIVNGSTDAVTELPEGADSVTTSFFNYYVTRARNPRAVNFVSSWTATTPMSFFEFPLMNNIKSLSPRPLLLIAGENAHSRYYSEDVYAQAAEPKELVIVPDADHVDLYDNFDKIPFDRIEEFFNEALN